MSHLPDVWVINLVGRGDHAKVFNGAYMLQCWWVVPTWSELVGEKQTLEAKHTCIENNGHGLFLTPLTIHLPSSVLSSVDVILVCWVVLDGVGILFIFGIGLGLWLTCFPSPSVDTQDHRFAHVSASHIDLWLLKLPNHILKMGSWHGYQFSGINYWYSPR